MNPNKKYQHLQHYLKQLGSLVVAFSGGVDSTFLLASAKEALGENVMAVTVTTPYVAGWEQDEAREISRELNVRHIFLETPLFENIKENPPQRCYLCKKQIFRVILDEARDKGYEQVADGTNIDDYQDIRPGIKALRELQVKSPLAENNIRKQEIRTLSRELGLPTWDKPAYACLLTRLPFNKRVRQELLDRIEKAELMLRDTGFPEARVRTHEEIARIEIPVERFQEFLQKASETGLTEKLKTLGYQFVTLDMEGYKMGSFNQSKE
jgi:uncharacterized protein